MPNEANLASQLQPYWTKLGLKLGVRRYQQLAKDEKVPSPVKGSVDALEAMTRIAIYYQELAENRGSMSLNDERTLKTREERLIKELQRQEKEGSLISKAAVSDEFVKRIYALKTDLLALPRRLSRWPEAKQIVDKALRQLMTNYSKQTGVLKVAK